MCIRRKIGKSIDLGDLENTSTKLAYQPFMLSFRQTEKMRLMKDYIDLNVVQAAQREKSNNGYSPLWFRDRLDLEGVYKHFYKFGNDYYGNVCVPTFTDIKTHNGRIAAKFRASHHHKWGIGEEYIWKCNHINAKALFCYS